MLHLRPSNYETSRRNIGENLYDIDLHGEFSGWTSKHRQQKQK
jgi:hypothetical protein